MKCCCRSCGNSRSNAIGSICSCCTLSTGVAFIALYTLWNGKAEYGVSQCTFVLNSSRSSCISSDCLSNRDCSSGSWCTCTSICSCYTLSTGVSLRAFWNSEVKDSSRGRTTVVDACCASCYSCGGCSNCYGCSGSRVTLRSRRTLNRTNVYPGTILINITVIISLYNIQVTINWVDNCIQSINIWNSSFWSDTCYLNPSLIVSTIGESV